MIIKRRIVTAGLGAAALISMAACSSSGGTSQSSISPGAGGGSLALKVGVAESLTGGLSAFGPSYAQVAKMAVADLQAAIAKDGASSKYSAKIVGVEDDQSDSTAGVEAAKKLIADGSNMILGSLSSTVTIAIANAATVPDGVLQIAPGSTSTALTNLDDNGLVFRTVPSDALTAKAMVSVLAKKYGNTATINIGARNDAFGAGFVAAFDADWKAQGGKIGIPLEWDPNSTSFDTQAQQLTATTPDAWVIIDFPDTWAKIGPALVRTGKWSANKTWTNQGLNTPDLPKLAGKQATESLNGVDPTSAGSQAQALEAKFKQQNPKLPYDAFAPPNYDAVVTAFLAMLEGGSDKSSDIAKNLTRVTQSGATVYTSTDLAGAIKAAAAGKPIDYQGPSGPLHFDSHGDPQAGTFETWKITNGKINQTSTFQLK